MRRMPVNRKSETVNDLLQNAAAEECAEKLERRMKDYGIEEGDYFSLALRLAIDHVSGFRPAQYKLQNGDFGAVVRDTKGGRPPSWTAERFDALMVAVDDAKRRYKLSTDDDALKYITRTGKWARPANRDQDKWIKTLKNSLGRARKIQCGVDDLLYGLKKFSANPEN